MNYYIISGEASGDLHSSNLLKELRKLDNDAHFRGWGGDLMQAQNMVLVKHYRELAFMGFAEVFMNIWTIFKNIEFCKKDILTNRPDVLILVDYPGFNLRIAEYAKSIGLKIFYYISPQIWAWKENRIHKIRRLVDKMFVILPFEKDFYLKHNMNVDFVGHPLLDAIKSFSDVPNTFSITADSNTIALLPGSRKQEINIMLPLMISVCKYFPDHQFVIAAAPSLDTNYYESFIKNQNIKIVYNQTYNLLLHSKAALVTSGTATLETALFGVPEVVCYKGGKISYHIAKRLIKVKFISLVNLIMDSEIVKELIQDELNEENLKRHLELILQTSEQEKLLSQYEELKLKLGGVGASKKTAELMYNYLN